LYEGTWQKFRGNTARANTLLDKSISSNDEVMKSALYELFAPTALGDSAQKYMFIWKTSSPTQPILPRLLTKNIFWPTIRFN
jgi:hypothetical protein